MPFGQERSQEDQVQLLVGNIMPKAPEIKKHRLKKLARLAGPAGVKPKLLTERNDPGK